MIKLSRTFITYEFRQTIKNQNIVITDLNQILAHYLLSLVFGLVTNNFFLHFSYLRLNNLPEGTFFCPLPLHGELPQPPKT